MSFIIAGIIVVVLVAVDLITKSLVFANIPTGEQIELIPNFLYISPITNNGAGFSILEGHTFLLLSVSTIATLGIIYLMKEINFKKRPFYTYGIILMLAGTMGNLYDRAFYLNHEVRDFIKPNPKIFPAIFNMADSFLTIGVILMGIFFIFFESKDPISLLPRKFMKKKEEKTDEQV